MKSTVPWFTFVLLLTALAASARGQSPAPRANPFACLGEGESLSRGMTTAEIGRRSKSG